MKVIYQLAIATLFLTSCNSEEINILPETTSAPRSTSNLSINITQSDQSVIEVYTSKFKIIHVSNNLFNVIANYGTDYEIVYSALSAQITEPDIALKLESTSGNSFLQRSSALITANSVNNLQYNIYPGNITGNALSLIGEEQDGF